VHPTDPSPALTLAPPALEAGGAFPLLPALALGLLLVVCASAALLRLALLRSLPSRVLASVGDASRRQRLATLLEKPDELATSAGLIKLTADLLFALLALATVAGGDALTWGEGLAAVLLAVPLLVLIGEVLPAVLVVGHGDRVLRGALPVFHWIQWPISPLARLIESGKHLARQALAVREAPHRTRQIVEGLREAIVDSEIEGGLGDEEREIVANAMELHHLDAAAIMTPRTEIDACDLAGGLSEALRVASESKRSRIPVYEGSLDSIVGTFSPRDVLTGLTEGRLDQIELRSVLRPVTFVPETKRATALLGEMRRQRTRLAVVLDEYGGTAGLVTMTDILAELVGDLQDEYDREEEAGIRPLDAHSADVDATERVSEVNEALDLELPEEADYETLGGFVLAQLGHFPEEGERFHHGEVEFLVTKASDRRVIEVRLRRLTPSAAG
jgi:putative hemolysin